MYLLYENEFCFSHFTWFINDPKTENCHKKILGNTRTGVKQKFSAGNPKGFKVLSSTRVTINIKDEESIISTDQHIIRHFYYTTMQKLCKFEALYRPEIECKCHKGSP